ncbi:MAG TPA: regulatory protein RecX [Anaerolineae bacterium]|nr:regulatory protein RecX [Anaerolineae bacterium]
MSRPAATAQQRREAAEARRARRAEITEPDVVMEAAAAFLAVRPRSVEETRRRLVQLGYPPALCEQVVERLVELGYLDDAAFARAWVESRDRARPRGAVALRRELQRKGVPEDIIRLALDERAAAGAAAHDGTSAASPEAGSASAAAPSADREAARRLIERRAAALSREPDPRRRRQKAYALLARNGFAPDICAELASSVADDPAEDVAGSV